MPIYEYQCKDCENRFEIYQGLIHEESVICPDCQSKEVEKKLSNFISLSSKADSCSSAKGSFS